MKNKYVTVCCVFYFILRLAYVLCFILRLGYPNKINSRGRHFHLSNLTFFLYFPVISLINICFFSFSIDEIQEIKVYSKITRLSGLHAYNFSKSDFKTQ